MSLSINFNLLCEPIALAILAAIPIAYFSFPLSSMLGANDSLS